MASEIKLKAACREFKSLIKLKMRNIITKKIWSHVKSTTRSTRISEVVSCGKVTTSDPITKANLFNEHFRKQFSECSNYNIEIDFHNDDNFHVDFSVSRIKYILNNLDINKAQGLWMVLMEQSLSTALLHWLTHCQKYLISPITSGMYL